MSIAGKRSSQGDEYQILIALHWLIRLLYDDKIEYIQVESTGLPGQDVSVTVDDIVIMYEGGFACFIQAKKNQKQYKNWSLSDLKDELEKARDQLESGDKSTVKFYSRSPFAKLQGLVEHCQYFPDYSSFQRDADENQKKSLQELSKILERSENVTFDLACKISFGPYHQFNDWDYYNLADLERLVPNADLAIDVLKGFLQNHATGLRDSKYCITRKDVLNKLRQKGISPTPKRSEKEILETFKLSSNKGRYWQRTIDGKQIPRPELDRIIELIEQEAQTILLVDGPGSGKTCLLLDLADRIEKERTSHWGLLFIKGDWFTDIETESNLVAEGLPEDIVGQCARLADYRRVVVIIDSLDVLSLSRQHSALKVFLGLIDRLEKVKNITVITACRKFDLDYDPLLRGRSWEHKINLQPLDFESVVKPFLDDWGIDSSSIGLELKELLKLPQNLSIYGELAKGGIDLQPRSAYELYSRFIQKLKAKNSDLWEKARVALQNMAEYLLNRRRFSCAQAALKSSEDIIRQLISEGILLNKSDGALIFSHQTLRDFFIVRSYDAHEKSLTEFILDRPQFPFIRPTVRAFFFYLRASNPKSFRQEVWKVLVLSDDKVAYHVKGLICESLAEIIPVEEDWRLLRRIFQQYPDLFRRCLSRLEGNAWFEILKKYWLPSAQQSQDKEKWLDLFCWKLKIWLDRYPAEVIALWREAIAFPWTDRQTLVSSISISLEELNLWKIEGLRELLESLIEYASDRQLDILGHCLSKWVQATNSGDDLLWKYITKNVLPEDTNRWKLKYKLSCEPYQFCQDNFLTERMNKSDVLLTLVLKDLERWSADTAASYGKYRLRANFWHQTSGGRRHSSGSIRSVDGLTALLNSLETALKQRASKNDAWWQENEPYWRDCYLAAIRYLLIKAYQENIEANIPGIEAQLQDEQLFYFGELNYELGELMQKAYPYISDTARSKNQSLILSLHDDLDTNIRECKLLVWIPSIFRTPETQSFIDDWQDCFDYPNFSPDIKVWGGIANPPLSSEELLKLSDEALLHLLHYYKDCHDTDVSDYRAVSSFSEVKGVLSEACSIKPERFLNIFDLLIQEGFHNSYMFGVIEGISNHLQYRFGNLRSASKKEPLTPLPEGEILAAKLLNLLERYPFIWENAQTVSDALKACCQVLNDPESADRLTLLLFWVRNYSQEETQIANYQRDIETDMLNSARGIAANSAMTLCNKLLEKEQPLPELLPSLVHNFARDPAIYARVPVLWHLPFLTYKKPEWGWQLLADVFQEPQPRLWKYADLCFYYQYRNRFDLVAPYLNRLLNEGMEEGGEIWGRISALASLAGHISQKELLDILLKTGNTDACEGVVRVFVANFDLHEHTEACRLGLITILKRESLSNKIILQVDKFFREEIKTNRGLIDRDLAVAFLEASGKLETYNFYGFLEWLGYKANLDPLVALDIAEKLAKKLDKEWKEKHIGHTEPLISVLNEILREADETDDSELIQRAINLQDCFLKSNIYGIEKFFTQAEQE